jgi:heme exporter protein C
LKISRLSIAAILCGAIALARVVYFTPFEAVQGPAQKIFYVHVPAAWAAFLCFGLVGLLSALYLGMREERLDRLAESAAEVGTVFTTVVLITGPLWAKPVWGTYWTWDARLTLTLFLWFIFVGYMILRGAVQEAGMRARYSAILGILGALLIPFIHLSVYMFRTLHPKPIVAKPDRPSLPDEMLLTLAICVMASLILMWAFMRARYRYAIQRDALLRGDLNAG